MIPENERNEFYQKLVLDGRFDHESNEMFEYEYENDYDDELMIANEIYRIDSGDQSPMNRASLIETINEVLNINYGERLLDKIEKNERQDMSHFYTGFVNHSLKDLENNND